MAARNQFCGFAAWWLPLARIENPGKEGGRLIFQRELGFRYDPAPAILEERFYPFRFIAGKAAITLPVNAALKWRKGSGDLAEARVLTSARAIIRNGSASTPVEPSPAWQPLPVPRSNPGNPDSDSP